MSDFPSGKIERSAIFLKTGLKVGTNYARFHLEKKLGVKKSSSETSAFHQKNAESVFKEFAKLRGTALKMAQALSVDRSVLPDEFADVLAQAQYQVPPISQTLVRQIIKTELGDVPENLFRKFDHKAFAAASLGQVHKAIHKDGRQIAVKVQYPKVRETIDSDLAMGKLLFQRLGKKQAMEAYFEEVKGKLMEETDYLHEGKQIQLYQDRYNHPDFITPEWIPEFSTTRVLTMTYIDGEHMGSFLGKNPTQSEKNRFGQLLWDFFHSQVNAFHTVHADTHPGNFLLTPDQKLGVLDFGCLKTCPPDFFNAFLTLMPAHYHENTEALLPLYYDLDLLYGNPEKNKQEMAFYDFCRRFGELMIRPYKTGFFDFSDQSYDKEMTKLLKEAVANGEPRGSRHFIYIARVVIGLYRMLIQLGAEIKTDHSFEVIVQYLNSHTDFEYPSVKKESPALL